ncbi:hypothetical protein [Lacticaseibacillus saniviri]
MNIRKMRQILHEENAIMLETRLTEIYHQAYVLLCATDAIDVIALLITATLARLRLGIFNGARLDDIIVIGTAMSLTICAGFRIQSLFQHFRLRYPFDWAVNEIDANQIANSNSIDEVVRNFAQSIRGLSKKEGDGISYLGMLSDYFDYHRSLITQLVIILVGLSGILLMCMESYIYILVQSWIWLYGLVVFVMLGIKIIVDHARCTKICRLVAIYRHKYAIADGYLD